MISAGTVDRGDHPINANFTPVAGCAGVFLSPISYRQIAAPAACREPILDSLGGI
jgi:hypothetical protein